MAGGRAAVGLLLLGCLSFQRAAAFNLDAEKPFEYTGPEGSYFGFSVDFFKSPNNVKKVVVDADGRYRKDLL